MTTTGYVGIEPGAAQWLAGTVERAGDDARATAGRIADLLAEAGAEAAAETAAARNTVSTLRHLEEELRWNAGDVRRRAALAQFDGGGIAEAGLPALSSSDPLCVVPWNDPLVRAARAIRANAANAGAGAWTSVTEGLAGIWQLVPGVDGWRQAWVDTAVGIGAAVQNPGEAVRAAAGVDMYDERGFAYWAGGFVPDLGFYLLGGAGAVKTTTRVANLAGDLGDKARTSSALRRAVDRLPGRRRGTRADGQPSIGHRPRRRRQAEQEGERSVRAFDEVSGGHAADKHGPQTTLEQQHRRAEHGITPDGQHSYRIHASRFLRWEDAAKAIEMAVEQRSRMSPPKKKAITVPFDHVVGEGYMKNTLEYRETKMVTVQFNDRGQPFTAFPDLKAGR